MLNIKGYLIKKSKKLGRIKQCQISKFHFIFPISNYGLKLNLCLLMCWYLGGGGTLTSQVN